jgi:uncharacterized membrane protein
MQQVHSGAQPFRLVAKRNDSLSPVGRRVFFVSILAVSFAIAAAWALNGVWYVLPFAGLEMAALLVALNLLARHARDYESVTIDGNRVLVEQCRAGRVRTHEFDRHWARLVTSRRGPGGGVLLAIRSHGREIPFGELLTDAEKAAVADELRKRLVNR